MRRAPHNFIATTFGNWLLRTRQVAEYHGILIADYTSNGSVKGFAVFAIQALQLIERCDPRAFTMVQRHVRYIVDYILLSGAQYRAATSECDIDFARYVDPNQPQHYEWFLATFAGAIVHEATHARIHAFGIPYNNDNWMRVEQMCVGREELFARRLGCARYDFSKSVPAFDRGRWEKHRSMSSSQRLKLTFARMKDVESNQESLFPILEAAKPTFGRPLAVATQQDERGV